ncbi:apolipoprotein D [Daphnia magna]|uniref:apolipoprotein D n=1 Tax=Daphnia magna TaxID=35525 RepID=UPI00140243F7|nr:apolipoprotein D [Daphnia magna]
MFSNRTKCWMLFLAAMQWYETAVNGQVFELGACQKPTVVSDLDVDRYLGKWFNNRNYFAVVQAKLDCITAVYAKTASGISVTNEGFNILTRQRSTAVGSATEIEQGKLGVSFSDTPATTANYWVLGTDYDNYAVVWRCIGVGPIRISCAWLLTRDQEPTSAVIDEALAVFNANGINTAPLKVTNQKNCPAS